MKTDSSKAIIEKMLTSPPPAFSATEAESMAASHYGIRGKVHPLVSERDQNFRLDAIDGKRYVLKISNAAEQLLVIDFQNRALKHIEIQDSSLPLPRVIPDNDGQLHCIVENGGKSQFIRVFSWLDGAALSDTRADHGLVNRLGRLLARLGLALEEFDHPGSNPPLLWDMKRAEELRDLLMYIEEPGLRDLARQTLDQFVSNVTPALNTLRTQVIHSDMNPDNVLIDAANTHRISGLIDFGDMVRSPLIMDLAIAAAYQLNEGDDPLSGALPMIAGYHAIRPLLDIEMELLTGLIRTRLITSLLIGSYRVTLFPENREYLMTSHESATNFLIHLQQLKADDALNHIQEACDSA
jgi:Ser/Thr protein kinase RdoA (MazF antagonist)